MRPHHALILCTLVSIAGCTDPGTEPQPAIPAAVAAHAGSAQSGPAATALPSPLVARVTDADGAGIEGVTVTWEVVAGGGSLSATSSVTDASGDASVTLTLGTVAGAQTARALVDDLEAVFTAEAVAGPPATLTLDASEIVFTAAGETRQLTAEVEDAHGNPVADPAVDWASSNTDVATVDGEGLVTAVAAGDATITATAGDAEDVASVSVDILDAAPAPAAFSLSAGQGHTCGLDGSGAAYCWGDNFSGQLGLGVSSPDQCGDEGSLDPCAHSPAAVAGGLSFDLIAAGEDHTCGITAEGLAYCWGDGSALGISTPPDDCGDFEPDPCARSPQAVEGGLTFLSLGAGGSHTCGVAVGGAAHCWGDNSSGQLGDGTTTDRATPVAVAGGHTFAVLDVGEDHTCALTVEGAAYCWGYGESLGVAAPPHDCSDVAGETDPCAMTPVAVEGGHAFYRISANSSHSCALTAAGAAYCWGSGSQGALGNGAQTDAATPTAVSGGHSFSEVATGWAFSCGLTSDGAAYCWGAGGDGELGATPPDECSDDIDPEPCALSPVAVSGGHAFLEIAGALDGAHACAITTAGAAYCWGDGDEGQLGDGAATDRTTAVAVSGGITFGRR